MESMSTQALQGELWSTYPMEWSNYFEPFFLPMYRAVLDELELSGSPTLLDAGCGAGLFSSLAIQKGADVIGLDAAPGLLNIARKRNPGTSFIEGDLESLPFPDEHFDLVAGFNSFQYSGNFENALTESKRVLKKEGKLIMGFWDKPEKSDATEILLAMTSLLPPLPRGSQGPFAFSKKGKIERLCKKLDLKLDIKLGIACPFLFKELQEGVRGFLGTGPAAMLLKTQSRESVIDVIASALKQFEITGGFYFLQNRFQAYIVSKR